MNSLSYQLKTHLQKFNDEYTFENLKSGLKIHGGSLCETSDTTFYKLNQPYVAVILLLKGTIRFALNTRKYEISAGEYGRCIIVAPRTVTLFTRYLVKDEYTTKLTISGVERWFEHVQGGAEVTEHALQPIYKEIATQLLDGGKADIEKDILALSLLNECRQDYAMPLVSHTTNKINNQQESVENTQDNETLTESYRFNVELTNIIDTGVFEVGTLANKLNISLRTLQRKIRGHYNCSAHDWVQQKRMETALLLLGEQGLSIGETAYLCGYTHSSNFIQAFRKYYGITPGALLNNQKN